mmetsp:Transcript_35434/g.58021  ORF Transcript_35434/g.58021 Transcript_35434/m.58021 type:complete len:650 (+) Transcript_35434:40-1989(+)
MDSTLTESLNVAKLLKEQNEELKAAFDGLKKEYTCLEQQLVHVGHELSKEVEAKKSLEMDCKNLYKRWNDELKIQAKEFEKLQSEMIPNTELELLRVRIVEELEISYSDKLQFMQTEMEKYHALYTKLYKQHEVLKINHDNLQQSTETAWNEERELLDYKLAQLKQECERLRNATKQAPHQSSSSSPPSCSTECEHRSLEWQEKVQSLTQQIEELNTCNSTLQVEMDESACARLQRIKECEAQILMKQAEHKAMKQKYDDLFAEYEASQTQLILQQTEISKLDNERSTLKFSLHAKKEEMSAINDGFYKKEKQWKQEHETQSKALRERLTELEQKSNKLCAENEDLQQELNTAQNKHSLQLQQMKQEHMNHVNELMSSKQDTEAQYHELKQRVFTMEQQHNKNVDALQRELELNYSRLQQTEAEMKYLQNTQQTYRAECDDRSNDVRCLKKENEELNHEYQALTNKYRECMDSNHTLSSKQDAYVAQIESLENDIQGMTTKIDGKFTALKEKYEREMAQVSEQKSTHEKTANKLKKEKQKYKKLAALAKMKINTLSKEVCNLKKNYQTEVQTKTVEITSLYKQMHELERQRDEIKFRLTMDSSNNAHFNIGHDHSGNNAELIANNVDILLKELEIEQKQNAASGVDGKH